MESAEFAAVDVPGNPLSGCRVVGVSPNRIDLLAEDRVRTGRGVIRLVRSIRDVVFRKRNQYADLKNMWRMTT